MAAARFIPEVVDQHKENGVALWMLRDNAVKGPRSRLSDLLALDERIEANIDGLRIAQMMGWSDSFDESEKGEAGDFFVAGILAVESGQLSRFEQITELAYARAAEMAGRPYHPAYDPWRGLVSALAWTTSSHVSGLIEQLLDTPRPRTRWLGVAACGARRIVRQYGLEAALDDREPMVRARAARTLGELGRSDSRAALNSLLSDSDPSCRFWAGWSAALLGTVEGLRALAEIGRSGDQWCEPALDLLLRRLPIESANEFIRPLGRDPRRRRTVIRATAMIGDPLYLPWLIEQIGDIALARCAGEALLTITGAEVEDVSRDPPPDLNDGSDEDPDDGTMMNWEDEGLAWLDPKKCDRWWEANRGRFRHGTPYFLGEPKTSVNWIDVLTEARQRLRGPAAIELALQRTGQAMFEVRGRGDLQRRLLRSASA
jgi:uncharacterized protein (TIGR02270 family)